MRALIEWTRRLLGTAGVSRPDRDLEEELQSHLDFARDDEQRCGETAGESARSTRLRLGTVAGAMGDLRDQRGIPSLDALAADVVFGWRQIVRHRGSSLSAVLALGLALGATMAAVRLVDALLLRPLPVAEPSRLFALTLRTQDPDGRPAERDAFDYPTFRRYRTTVDGHAELMLVGMAFRRDIRIDGADPERAGQQFVSGNFFTSLGLHPAVGRLFVPTDDVTPDGHPVAVISHDFWRRRFGGDPAVVGRTFQVGPRVFEIIGVAPKGFTGTEPGALTEYFLPSMMNGAALDQAGWAWFRIWMRPGAGLDPSQVHARLQGRFRADQLERVKRFPPDTPKSRIDAFHAQRLELVPAGSGISGLQRDFRRPLWILTVLAVLLLLIAGANVANILLARAMSRRTEMALRISIGATRGRLVRLMIVESAMLAIAACALGATFAAYAGPVVVSMLAPAESPVRLVLDLDWRSFGSGAAITLLVTTLFALPPALRASSTAPIGALKDGPARQRRLTEGLVASQMALCVFLLVGMSLFVGTFEQLRNKPLGFQAGRLIHAYVESRTSLQPAVWDQLAAELRQIPGLQSAALAGWAPLTGNRWRWSVSVDGTSTDPAPNWVAVSPGYFETMRTPLIEGRELRLGDVAPSERPPATPGVAVVNEAFARAYMGGRSPVGRRVIVDSSGASLEIVGMAADAVYFSVREPAHPAVYIPLGSRREATLMVRMADSGDLRPQLEDEVRRIRPELTVSDADLYEKIVGQQMLRERLLAALSTFLGALALILAVIGISGVLNYAVTRERRQIGVRMALGARPAHVLAMITRRLFAAVGVGALVGTAAGLAFGRWVQTLLFGVEPTDTMALLLPLVVLAAAAIGATIRPAIRAIRIDPAQTIRSEV
jgi:predicted permease